MEQHLRRSVSFLAIGATGLFSSATPTQPVQSQRPVLVLAITVDQLRGDYLDRFAAQLNGGLARLARDGAVFTHAYQDQAVTETAPGHATILSGRYPASTGIIRNPEGVPDSSTTLLEVGGVGASPRRFRGTALFDWIRARYPRAHAFSVAIKDRGAILPIGRATEQVYWWAGGRFTTSNYYAESLPGWVRAFNRAAASVLSSGLVWNPLLEPSAYPEPDSMPYENRGRDFVFPHRLPHDVAEAARAVASTPFGDSLTLAFALAGIHALGLGRGPQSDLVHIGLSATDYIGHAYGPDSRELHDQVLRVDRWLGTFLDSLARLRDMRRIVFVVTADHGVTSFPEWARAHGVPGAGYVDVDTLLLRYRSALEARLGRGRWLQYREAGMVALDRRGLAAAGVNVDSLVATMAGELERIPGLARVDTRSTLAERTDTVRDPVLRRWRHMLPPDAPAELFLTLAPGKVFGPPGQAKHGQSSDEDAHVTLILSGEGVRPGRYENRVSTVDIAPTLARLLGVPALGRVDGRVLSEALETGRERSE